ncbi:MAG: hypothetical protein DI563_13440 [Variovorax paradoxus]|uniref:Dyp-type peroxidase C-terminal domain-containing protein n=1 Tax=Variovorax paradoxus TaxID=34073 RepID=A0A2W5Q9B8_VARPD|nr:MAG: hypothetical protein DI563_13440 [Variovorax paradoxus]
MPTLAPATSRTLRGITDLTLAAPLKRGLVVAPDARSHETRLTLLLRSLNTLRYASLEIDPASAIPDMIDRVRALQSFRLALTDGFDGSRQLLLAVSFDGGWEPYMRRVWRDLGPLLDVIFCNCEGYLLARTHAYADYARWVRSAQRNTEFFYTASPVTVNDLHWLREQQRTPAPPPPRASDATLAAQALPGLTALYRLTELYPSGTADGDCLLHAAHHLLLPLWERMSDTASPLPPSAIPCRTPTEEAAVAWFTTRVKPSPAAPVAKCPAHRHWPPPDAQAGIVKALPATPTHGALLLIECDDANAIARLVRQLDPATLGARAAQAHAGPWRNLFFTLAGLKKARVPDGLLACMPAEFLEGMEARAAVLGDLEADHPQHWTLPERNWPLDGAGATPARVALASVHLVVQILVADTAAPGWQALNTDHPACTPIKDFEKQMPPGARILSVQPLHRNIDAHGRAREHFGFADGLSNPVHPDDRPAGSPAAGAWDRWALGDYLLGYGNSHDDPPLQGRFWTDSTFLVVRKLRQDVDALQAMVGGPPAHSELAALMVGRHQDGRNLVDGTPDNAFDYANDPAGAQCPLHAHVRRANPRGLRPDLQVLPRILRRGMSYGPPHTAQTAQEERGVVFMAYNASIAEQFELIQSWLSGGNSGGEGTYSGQRDPIFARPRPGDRDSFVFGPHPQPAPLPLPAAGPRPVALQWGLYLFVPSVPALEDIARFAAEAGCPVAASTAPGPASAERAAEAKKGAIVIAKLKAAESALGLAAAREQWKLVLEDLGARQNGTSQWLWTAVRDLHGGVLRTPYGVLVGSRDRVMEVLGDDRSFSATGYCPRMASSFGTIYLGMDQGPEYRTLSTVPNEAIMAVTRRQAFDAAFADTRTVLDGWRAGAGAAGFSFDVKDLVDAVLAAICTQFFGLPEGPGSSMRIGGWQARIGQANADQPSCPGHFGAPSRYMFQPNPGEGAVQQGQDHGRALKDYVEARLHAGGPDLQSTNDSVIGAKLRGIPKAQYASTLIGIMMGFLPTVDGTLRSALYEWVADSSLWSLQLAWAVHDGAGPSAALATAGAVIEPALRRTMQLRPVPELVWRTATARRMLGAVELAPGERIVVGIVSAMQQNLQEGSPDLWPVFGGRRAGEQHPTHACPGYEMAMGVMLGVLAGLLGAELRPSLSLTVLRLMP